MMPYVITALTLLSPLRSGSVEPTGVTPGLVRVEQRLCRGRIRHVKISPYGGMSIKVMLYFPGGHRAVFKPEQSLYSARYQAEIAAYRLATHLGVGLIPPACERTLRWDTLMRLVREPRHAKLRARMQKEIKVRDGAQVVGVAIHFVPRVHELPLERRTAWKKWLKSASRIPPRHLRRAGEIADMLLLDLLFSNPDRFTGGNVLINLANQRLLMIDNAADFRPVEGLIRPYHRETLSLLGRVRRPTYDRLRQLDAAALRRTLMRPGSRELYLTRQERHALLTRRADIVRHVEALRRVHGDGAVFLP